MMKNKRWHHFVWKFLRLVMRPYTRFVLGYRPEQCKEKGTLLVISNHVTDWDPIFLGASFPRLLTYVASEHIFRWGFASKVIQFLFAPIPRLKGSTAVNTAMAVMKHLHKGENVCIFAEGNRSFAGQTEPIYTSTGKLAKKCGATLVTYRLHGGYLASPRWSGSKIRKGKMTGEVVGVYPPEQLKTMSPEEIVALIERDIFVDAYAEQRELKTIYKCKERAKGLERLLWLCPSCKKTGTLHSEGNDLTCDCGFHAFYNEESFLEGNNLPADNLTDWDNWQTEELKKHIDTCNTPSLFSDEGIEVQELYVDHTTSTVDEGTLSLTKGALQIGEFQIPLSEVQGISVHGPQTIALGTQKNHYEIKSSSLFCARKYVHAVQYIKHQHTGGFD